MEVGDDGHEVLEEPERGFLRVEKGRVIDRVYEGYGLVRAGWINVLEAGEERLEDDDEDESCDEVEGLCVSHARVVEGVGR